MQRNNARRITVSAAKQGCYARTSAAVSKKMTNVKINQADLMMMMMMMTMVMVMVVMMMMMMMVMMMMMMVMMMMAHLRPIFNPP